MARIPLPHAPANFTRSAGRRRGPGARSSRLVRRFGLWAVLVIVVAVLMIASPTFRQPINLENVLQQNAIIGIVACGMAVMMIVGGFDLSVGAVGATSSTAAAWVSESHGTTLAVLAGLAVGLVNRVGQRAARREGQAQRVHRDLRDGERRVRAAVRGHRRAVRDGKHPVPHLARE